MVCAWSTCLKTHKCKSMIWPWNSSWKFPKHRKKPQNPKSPFWVTLVSWKSTSWQSAPPCNTATVQCQPWDMSCQPKLWRSQAAMPCWGSLTWQCYGAVAPLQPPPDRSIGKIIPDCTSLCGANSQGSFPVISPTVWQCQPTKHIFNFSPVKYTSLLKSKSRIAFSFFYNC